MSMVSNPFKTGRYCVAVATARAPSGASVSNPFKTGRYCVDRHPDLRRPVEHPEFQTPSKRGGTA